MDVRSSVWGLALELLLPMYLANAMPVVASKLPFLARFNEPLDEVLFGKNKTFRGLFAAMFGGGVGMILVYFLFGLFYLNSPIVNWEHLNYLRFVSIFYVISVWGIWLGLGAIVGDLVKSFFKRRFKIPPGQPWFPFDQLDFILGGFFFYYLFKSYASTSAWHWSEKELIVLFIALLITPPLHLLANVIAYKLGWKKVWW